MKKNWHEDVFFGLHFDIHANKDDDKLGENLTVEHLIKELEKINPDFVQCDCKGHPGYTSYPTKIGTPAPGIVKDAVKIWRQATDKLNIPLGMHYSGVWDRAALIKHPKWSRVKAEESKKDENMTCTLSEYTDEYMIKQMLEIIDRYDVDGFWVDGENWAVKPCYCDRCKSLFKKHYDFKHIPKKPADKGWKQWLEFNRTNFLNHVRKYAKAIHEKKPECTVCSNWMYTVRQPEEISVPVDYLSGDFPFIWSALKANIEAKFMDSRGLSWDLMAWGFTSYGPPKHWTFKSVPGLCQEAAVVMSNGGSFMIYDQPNRTGELISWHMDKIAEVAKFVRARQEYCQYAKSVPQIALMHSKDHYYKNNSPSFNTGEATKPLEGALFSLLENHYHVDILNDDNFIKNADKYKLCVVAEQDDVPANQIEKLKQYVKNGGRLIVSGAEHTKHFDDLSKVSDLGKTIGEKTEQALYIKDKDETFLVTGDWRLVKKTKGIKVQPLLLGRALGIDIKKTGSPVAMVNKYGKGYIACIFGSLFESYANTRYPGGRHLIQKIIGMMDVDGLINIDAPLSLNITVRRKDNRLMINFVNLGSNKPLSPGNAYIENVPVCGPVTISLKTEDKPKHVYKAPAGEPVRWDYNNEERLLEAKIQSVGIHDILVVEN